VETNTGATGAAAAPAFQAEGDDQLVRYGSLSTLALLGLVFGLAAPLCFMAPLLLAIPLLGAGVSLVALRHIEASEGVLVGRTAALTGLALCVGCGCAMISRVKLIEHLHYRQAESLSLEWLGLLLSDQVEPAFRLTVLGASPATAATDLPPGEPAKDPLQEFSDDPVVQAVRAAGKDAEIRREETLAVENRGQGQYLFRRKYVITPRQDPPRSEPFGIVLTLQRGRLPGRRSLRWVVMAYESDDLPGSPVQSN